MNYLNVKSEIGKLKRVLLHEPGLELENLTPTYLNDLLFDDIPWLPLAVKEHQAFAKTLKDNGVEVVYLSDLVAESLSSQEIIDQFINQYIVEANIVSSTLSQALSEYLHSIKDKKQLVLKTMSGIRKSEIKEYKTKSLADMINKDPFITDPIPNLYFTRDPFAIINNGVSINKMYSKTRMRETLYAEYIFKYHKDFKDAKHYYERNKKANIEGGDILVLSDKVIAIGVSQRTSPFAIEEIAKQILWDKDATQDTILAFTLPNARTFMHLDTIFTQVDYDKFAMHASCIDTMQVYEIKKSSIEGKIDIKLNKKKLAIVLEEYLGRPITLIPCGGHDSISSDREQWSDGANTLCIAPGVVIVYERNQITNHILEEYGIKVLTVPSSELSRGRGGPRCMSMPLYREDLKEN